MALFDELQPASFAGLAFPVQEVTVKGAQRYHVHEYLHTAGGSYEPLGRRPYMVTMRVPFHNTFAKYPRLWETLGKIQLLFDEGGSHPLHIPTVGTITARMIDMTRTWNTRFRSGENAEFQFIEDQDQTNLVEQLVQAGADSLAAKVAAFNIVLAEELPNTNLFDALQNAANSVLAYADTAQMYTDLAVAKVEGLAEMCRAFDRRVEQLNQPAYHRVLSALVDVGAASVELAQDIKKAARPVDVLVLDATMSIVQVAAIIYNDTAKATELLQLNDLDDALVIPAGTQIRHYAKAA